MSLARVKTWNPGDVLTAADLNGEFNNVLNNPISLVSPTTGAINFNLQAHTNLVPTAITASSGSAGQVLTITGGSPGWAAAVTGGLPSRVSGLLGVLSSQSATFSAEFYQMRSTALSQSWTVAATSSYTVSIGTAGPAANGRDQAAAFASTYVHFYAISTGSGSTAPAGLVSTNPPTVGPVALPANYSGWTYLTGSPYSSTSTALTDLQTVSGARAYFVVPPTLLSNGNSTAITAVTMSSELPPNARSVQVLVQLQSTDGANNDTATIAFTSSGGGASINVGANAAGGGVKVDNSVAMTIPTSAQTLWYNNSTGIALTSITLLSYSVSNGDV